MFNRYPRAQLNLAEIADWKVNCPEAGQSKIRLPHDSKGIVWNADRIEDFWDDILSDRPLGSFKLRKNGHLPQLLEGEQRATALALGFYDPWEKNADSWEDMQKEGLRRYAPQIEGPAGVLWLDIASHGYADHSRNWVFRLVTHNEPWGFLRNSRGHLPENGQHLAWENFIRVIRCQKEIPNNESLPAWANGDTIPLAWAWPWDAITPMPFPLLIQLAGINTPEWEEFLLFSIENNPMWQLDCPMPTASTHCWKEKICQILKHREGEDYDRLSKLVKILPNAINRTIAIEYEE